MTRSGCKSAFRIALGLLFLFAGQLTASAKDNWTSVRTQNFLLVGNASDKEIREVATRLEQFRKAFALLLPGMKVTSSVPTTVIVFKSEESYKPFQVNPKSSGYFQAGEDVNYITLTTRQTGGDNPFRTIFHEYVHLLIHNTMGHTVPLWFNEGLAEYYSTFSITDDNRKVILGDLIRSHILELRADKLLPLRTLFAVDYKSPYYKEGNKINIFYAESWMLLHYLMQGDNQRRRPQLDRFIELIRSDVAMDDAFRQAFQTDVETFEREFKSYIQSGQYMATAITFGRKLEAGSEMRSAAVTDDEVQAYLGDLLLHTNRFDVAETRLQAALNLKQDLPMALTSLGILRVRQGRFEDAKQCLRKAVAADSQNYLAHYYYAYALSREGMDEHQVVSRYPRALAQDMRAELRSAIALKKDFPESYALLAFVNVVRNEEIDETIALLKQAHIVSSANPRVLFVLAQLYLREADFAAARQLLEPIARNSPEPQIRERAQALLEGLDRAAEQTVLFAATTREAASNANRTPGDLRDESEPREPDPSTNLANVLTKPREGETRVQGMLTGIECNAAGINFLVRVGQRFLNLHADSFAQVSFRTYTKDIAGDITCGPRKPENPVIVTYTVPANRRKWDGQPNTFEFVPKDFLLQP
ncbi:MAG TPA: tetratricopeptide repeat protein [Pyrinomonadaceae bacterium]|nr:tetratricopeptide repeat protein [Pyrinomonadaceae bacterium]